MSQICTNIPHYQNLSGSSLNGKNPMPSLITEAIIEIRLVPEFGV